MKKFLKISGIALLSAAVCLTAASILTDGSKKAQKPDENSVFQLQMKEGGPLRLAVFTDLHLDGLDPIGMVQAAWHLRKNVQELRPDLVAILGDNVLCPFNHLRTWSFTRLMDSFGLPWTAVLGNHEGENKLCLQRRDVLKYYKRSQHFLGETELPGVTGTGNQAIVVLNAQGQAVQVLYFLDSGGVTHDYVQADQLGWLTRAAGGYPGVPGMVFMHIPAWQYREAYEALESGEAELLRGQRGERVCTGGTEEQSAALVARAGEAGVRAFVSGHDHANNFDISYRGMRYIYAQSGGYSRICFDERSKDIRGCTVFVIDPGGAVEVEQNFNG